ncbi:MAG: hypothetical protein QOE14_3003 [Humisphaera sp.]|nr:hypothetical protein [Humisphaera sp.]
MNEHDENEFDDPAFKAALRRTLGTEAAPASLRAQVTSLLAAEAGAGNGATEPASSDAASPSSSRPRRRGRLVIDRNFWRTAATAACVFLVLGWVALQIRNEFFPPSPYGNGDGGAMTAIPASVVLDVVKTHDACAKLPDHHLIPGNDPEALHDKLTAGAGVTASSVNLGGEWQFKGAGVCQVGDKRAAHLLFVRREEYVSIFSMLAPEGCGYSADSYKDTVDQHPIAGFRHSDALYCVVGSASQGEFTRAELDTVLQKVQASVAAGCMTQDTMLAAAAASGHRDR